MATLVPVSGAGAIQGAAPRAVVSPTGSGTHGAVFDDDSLAGGGVLGNPGKIKAGGVKEPHYAPRSIPPGAIKLAAVIHELLGPQAVEADNVKLATLTLALLAPEVRSLLLPDPGVDQNRGKVVKVGDADGFILADEAAGGSSVGADDSTLQLLLGILSIKAGGVGTAQLADAALTGPKAADDFLAARHVPDALLTVAMCAAELSSRLLAQGPNENDVMVGTSAGGWIAQALSGALLAESTLAASKLLAGTDSQRQAFRAKIGAGNIVYRGPYADNTAYAVNELVVSGGAFFLAQVAVPDTNSTAPANGATWKQWGGGVANPVSHGGTFALRTAYAVGTVLVFGGELYYVITAVPDTNAANPDASDKFEHLTLDAFDLYADVSDELSEGAIADDDRLLGSDVSANGRPNKWLSFATLKAWVKRHLPPRGFEALAFAAQLTWDVDAKPNATITLTANVTSVTLTNSADGGVYVLRIREDATGGRTFALPSAWKKPKNDANGAIQTGANKETILTLMDIDGAIYRAPLMAVN